MKFWILSFLMILTSSCSYLSYRTRSTPVPVDPKIKAEEESEIKSADAALYAFDLRQAEKLYAAFQERHPNSIFYQKAQFGRAKALEGQERWAEAAELYRKTLDATMSTQPEIAAQALYELSFCYENLGDEARVLASLQDALRLKEYLTPEQIYAEIPARIAASYSRMGRTKEAEQSYREAEQGVQRVIASIEAHKSPAEISAIYFSMGLFSTNQISYENLQASLDTLRLVQTFSLRSVETGGQPWAKMAFDGLTMNYRDIWRVINQIPLNKAMDPGAARRERTDRQMAFAGQILSAINELRMYRSPSVPESNLENKELFSFMDRLEKQANDMLYAMKERNPLTPEAETHGGQVK